jgi:lipopolysaccharide/colanic/teichoic acid biosynthesis glycosyltransferase
MSMASEAAGALLLPEPDPTRPGRAALRGDEPGRRPAYRRVGKATIDRIGAAALLLLLSWLLVLIAVAIRLSSAGPVLFRQRRVGQDRQPFTMYKFRSMYGGAEHQLADLTGLSDTDGLLFKLRRDPRVTRAGRLLRRFSLDELPQLANVLRGQMSLVGPRPPLPTEVACYDDEVGGRLSVRPGMTGLWQVSGRSDLSFSDGVRLDLHYAQNVSLALDLIIVVKTVFAVLGGRGAY